MSTQSGFTLLPKAWLSGSIGGQGRVQQRKAGKLPLASDGECLQRLAGPSSLRLTFPSPSSFLLGLCWSSKVQPLSMSRSQTCFKCQHLGNRSRRIYVSWSCPTCTCPDYENLIFWAHLKMLPLQDATKPLPSPQATGFHTQMSQYISIQTGGEIGDPATHMDLCQPGLQS